MHRKNDKQEKTTKAESGTQETETTKARHQEIQNKGHNTRIIWGNSRNKHEQTIRKTRQRNKLKKNKGTNNTETTNKQEERQTNEKHKNNKKQNRNNEPTRTTKKRKT